MANLFLAAFLLVFGLNILIGFGLPNWITAILAVIAGILILVERANGRSPRK